MLYTGLKSVFRRDSDVFRQTVYRDLKSRSVLVRIVENFYSSSPVFIKAFLLGIYGTGSFFRSPGIRKSPYPGIWRYGNELREYEDINRLFAPDAIEFCQVRGSQETLKKICLLISRIHTWPRTLKLLQIIAVKYPFLIAARMSDTIFSYVWFETELKDSDVKILFLSSEANPYAMAALWAAKKNNVRTCYVPHGFVAENPPPLHFDLNLLDGPALRKLYENSGAISGSVGYRGLPGPSAPMRVKSPGTIGFFLSLIYDEEEVVREINSAITTLNPARVLIRPHPNEVLGKKIFPHARIQMNSKNLLPTSSLDRDISECDLIFCGNSSVHLLILKRGIPTIQLRGFDTLPFDTRQFIRNRIVFLAEKFPVLLSELSDFYGEGWSMRFREYDASYLLPEEERRSRIRDLLTNFSGNGKG